AFNNAFKGFHRRNILTSLAPEIADFYTRRESTLTRLEEIATRAAENTEAHRRLLEERFEGQRQQLEAEYEGRLKELESEFSKRMDAIGEREKTLVQREVELEKADNTHARRKLRQELKNVLKERHDKFTLTSDTQNKRRPIFWTFIALMTVTV